MIASPKRHPTRRGFSLMEVLVALAIFLLAFAGISRLVTFASDRALDVKLQSQATQLCQTKLAEVVAGAVPLSSQADVSLDEDPSWTWSLDAEQGSVPGLWNVTVKVKRQQSSGAHLEASLSQMVLDPSQRGSTLDAVAAANAAAAAATSASNSGTNSGGTTASSSPTAAGASGKATSTGGSSPKTGTSAPGKASTSGGSPKSSSPTSPSKSSTSKGGN
jgi:general secretion pathway protein I